MDELRRKLAEEVRLLATRVVGGEDEKAKEAFALGLAFPTLLLALLRKGNHLGEEDFWELVKSWERGEDPALGFRQGVSREARRVLKRAFPSKLPSPRSPDLRIGGEALRNFSRFLLATLPEGSSDSSSLELLLGVAVEWAEGKGLGEVSLGAHYTPREVVRLMWRLSLAELLFRKGLPMERAYGLLRGESEKLTSEERERAREVLLSLRVLDPSTGPGVFLVEGIEVVEEVLLALGEGSRGEVRRRLLPNFHGLDIFPWAVWVTEARLRLAHLEASPSSPPPPLSVERRDTVGEPLPWSWGYDLVIGNPPYVRQEEIRDPTGKRDARAYKDLLIEEAWKSVVRFLPEEERKSFPKPSGRSDLYLYFYARTLGLLNPKGVHAFVVSNSWLETLYGAWLRRVFLEVVPLRYVIESQVERSFRADVNTVITVAHAPEPGKKVPADWPILFVAVRRPFEEVNPLEELWKAQSELLLQRGACTGS